MIYDKGFFCSIICDSKRMEISAFQLVKLNYSLETEYYGTVLKLRQFHTYWHGIFTKKYFKQENQGSRNIYSILHFVEKNTDACICTDYLRG